MKTKLDLSKPLQLTDGRPARLLCDDREGGNPIVVLVNNSALYVFPADGSSSVGFPGLINVPEPAQKQYWRSAADFPSVCWIRYRAWATSELVTGFNDFGTGFSRGSNAVMDLFSDLDAYRWSDRPGTPWDEMQECVVEGGAA